MVLARLLSLLLLLALLPGCAPLEPINGCTLAAVNRREILRARAFVHPAIPARILVIGYPGRSMGHAALVYHLDPEGWFAYDDTYGSRSLAFHDAALPDPLSAARAAFPGSLIARACYLKDTRPSR